MLKIVFTVLSLAFFQTVAFAATLSVPFTLSFDDPIFNRPRSTTLLSGVGTATHYTAIAFYLNADSLITVSLSNNDGANLSPSGSDTVLSLYQNGFLPSSPLSNIIGFNDDICTSGGSICTIERASRIVLGSTQSASNLYIAVITSFDNVPQASTAFPWTGNLIITTDNGAFLSSQGVPEPTTVALCGTSLLIVLLRRRS